MSASWSERAYPYLLVFDPPEGRASRNLVRATDPLTSQAAAASMRGRPLSKQRAQVLSFIRASNTGATAFEISVVLEMQQSVVARRCTDLHELGLIVDSGRTRPGSTGRQLTVWVTS
jgi:hypothetical protein